MSGGNNLFLKGNTVHEKRVEIANYMRSVKDFGAAELRKLISMLLDKSEGELDAYIQGGLTPIKYVIFAKLVKDIVTTDKFTRDDIAKLDFLLDRSVGKVKEETTPTNQFRALPTQELLVMAEEQIRQLKAVENANTIQVEATPESERGHIPTGDAGQADCTQTDPQRNNQQ